MSSKKLNWLQRYVRRADPMEAFLLSFSVVFVAAFLLIGAAAYVYTGGL